MAYSITLAWASYLFMLGCQVSTHTTFLIIKFVLLYGPMVEMVQRWTASAHNSTPIPSSSGKGHFFYRGQVEDSATAEISRSQVV